MAKKHDLPYMPFYWGDWFKCPEVRALSPEARCLWFEMLGLMWESTERGFLTLNGKPMSKETIGRCLGFAIDLLSRLLSELEQFGVYSVRADGAIYNRRMVRDAEISSKRAIAGKIGADLRWQNDSKTIAKGMANADNEDEDENECILSSLQEGVRGETRPPTCRRRGKTVPGIRFGTWVLLAAGEREDMVARWGERMTAAAIAGYDLRMPNSAAQRKHTDHAAAIRDYVSRGYICLGMRPDPPKSAPVQSADPDDLPPQTPEEVAEAMSHVTTMIEKLSAGKSFPT